MHACQWQTLHQSSVNDVTEWKQCVPIAPVDQSQSEKSVSDGVIMVLIVKE